MTNQGLGSFLVKLQTSSKSISTKVYDALNSYPLFIIFFLICFDELSWSKGWDSKFVCYIRCAAMLLALWNPFNL